MRAWTGWWRKARDRERIEWLLEALTHKRAAIDVERCPTCGDKMKLLSVVTAPDSIARILRNLGEPTLPEPLAPARAPPYYKRRLLRRKAGQSTTDAASAA